MLKGVRTDHIIKRLCSGWQSPCTDSKNWSVDSHSAAEISLGTVLLLGELINNYVGSPMRLIAATDIKYEI